jgi:hypothetical protein
MAQTTENAVIKSVDVFIEDHGILTMYLNIEGEGWGCGAGGYALDSYNKALDKRIGSSLLAAALLELFRVFEVSHLNKLVGLPCRVETEGLGGGIIRLGHFTKNKWFSWKKLAEDLKGV